MSPCLKHGTTPFYLPPMADKPNAVADVPLTSLHDVETILVRGFLTRQVLLQIKMISLGAVQPRLKNRSFGSVAHGLNLKIHSDDATRRIMPSKIWPLPNEMYSRKVFTYLADTILFYLGSLEPACIESMSWPNAEWPGHNMCELIDRNKKFICIFNILLPFGLSLEYCISLHVTHTCFKPLVFYHVTRCI